MYPYGTSNDVWDGEAYEQPERTGISSHSRSMEAFIARASDSFAGMRKMVRWPSFRPSRSGLRPILTTTTIPHFGRAFVAYPPCPWVLNGPVV